MDWKRGLDIYLTSNPDDWYTSFYEHVTNLMRDVFFDENEDWILRHNGQCDKWMYRLWRRGKTTRETAAIIERGFNIFKQYL